MSDADKDKLIADLTASLLWAMREGRLAYRHRIKGQNDAYCDAVDRANAVLHRAKEGAQS